MALDRNAIHFIEDSRLEMRLWPGLDNRCRLTIATADHPEGLPHLEELICDYSDLSTVLDGVPLEIMNAAGGVCRLEAHGDRVHVSFADPESPAIGYGHVSAQDYRDLVRIVSSV